jgi:hypothetical protein
LASDPRDEFDELDEPESVVGFFDPEDSEPEEDEPDPDEPDSEELDPDDELESEDAASFVFSLSLDLPFFDPARLSVL